jgi:glycosyltransferase involved in cell wall biosynthesis
LATARREAYDVAYSSSGPFTSHLIGLLLKRTAKRPWIAELRDGWYRWNRAIFPDYPAWRDAVERRLEAAALRAADRVVLVTERMAAAFRAQYAGLSPDHFSVVSNGFDPVQFETVSPLRSSAPWDVVHAGALYYGRSIAPFLQAVRGLIDSHADFARDFRLSLIGTLDATAAAELAASGLADKTAVRGQLDHRAALAAMGAADALLLVANTTPGADAAAPGKLFEYLAIGRPVLAVAPHESATADVLQQTGGGWLADPADAEAIARVVLRAYHERSTPLDTEVVSTFDRRRLAGELSRIFDQVQLGARRT